MNSNLSFEKFAQDAHEYLNNLAEDLGHPEEKQRVLIIWRSVMHTIRDRIHLGESFQLIDPLPMIFKGIYGENWKFSEKPPLDYDNLEVMKNEVKRLQKQHGEEDFDWKKPTEEIIRITFRSLDRFLNEGQLIHIINQFPKEIQNQLVK